MSEAIRTHVGSDGRVFKERKTGRGNRGNEKFKELQRLEDEWKKAQLAKQQ